MNFSTSSWKARSGSATVYERPLGLTELGLYWDAVFERTADTLQHATIVVDQTRFQDAISPANISRIWTNLKHQFPLLSAQLEERDEDAVFFVVSERYLQNCRPGEITFQNIASQQEADNLVDRIIAQDNVLSNSILACVYVLQRTDIQNCVHLVIHVSHCITDGMSNITVLRTFLDQLCQESFPVPDLKQRLALSVASEDLIPQRKFSLPRRRWRNAIAQVIVIRRNPRTSGGHTLPRKVSQTTPYTPALSKSISVSFSPEKSIAIILNCRENRLTFGNAYPVLAQIALTRVLLRRYLRGEIDAQEWEFRKREPMATAGPLNMRPLLDKDWFEAGGQTNVCLAISSFILSLPFMPLGSASCLRPGMEMPSFESLLSKKRFILRWRSIKNQMNAYIRHPLFLEFAAMDAPARIQRQKAIGLQWRKDTEPPKVLEERLLSPMEQASGSLIFGSGGSSMGNVDHLLPLEYPLANPKGQTLVHLTKSRTILRCRPMELYLAAATSRQQLSLVVFWDGNVFDERLVTEWLDEVMKATDFYLGHDGVRVRL